MKDRLIIMGCAPCLENDLNGIKNQELYDFMAVGVDSVGIAPNPVSLVVSYHKEDFKKIKEKMKKTPYKTISHRQTKLNEINVVIPTLFGEDHYKTTGSSTLLGVCYAIQEGYKKIILAGCPLDGVNKKNQSYSQYRKGWQFHKDKVLGKVKSMSGWTREFLGEPTDDWFSNLAE